MQAISRLTEMCLLNLITAGHASPAHARRLDSMYARREALRDFDRTGDRFKQPGNRGEPRC